MAAWRPCKRVRAAPRGAALQALVPAGGAGTACKYGRWRRQQGWPPILCQPLPVPPPTTFLAATPEEVEDQFKPYHYCWFLGVLELFSLGLGIFAVHKDYHRLQGPVITFIAVATSTILPLIAGGQVGSRAGLLRPGRAVQACVTRLP